MKPTKQHYMKAAFMSCAGGKGVPSAMGLYTSPAKQRGRGPCQCRVPAERQTVAPIGTSALRRPPEYIQLRWTRFGAALAMWKAGVFHDPWNP